MTDHFKHIYAHHAAEYERMVAREDYRGNLFAALTEIHSPDGAVVADLGAGTGRMTRLLSVMARRVIALDMAPAMLHEARHSLELTGMRNWSLVAADNRALPLPAASVDIAIEGWSFGHAVGWNPDGWQADVGAMLAEMRRILKPGGTAILLETLGTGSKQPQPPTPGLAALYAWWEQEHGFAHRWLRTDYQFESVAEADALTRFFFGAELADRIVREKINILPECTGLWYRTF
ncbi:MAG: class I SAM-dependent methyltransferase [Anaerolineae bacterium]|jgi:ubiquinone/menaquinone biosynthesis C-methylase UbiE|nr:class I SAM-dependent methyltransferase [Anaerolineae bacterium]